MVCTFQSPQKVQHMLGVQGKVQLGGCLSFIGCVCVLPNALLLFSMSTLFLRRAKQLLVRARTCHTYTCLHSTGQHKKWMFHKLQLKLLHFWLDFLWFWRGSSLAGGIFGGIFLFALPRTVKWFDAQSTPKNQFSRPTNACSYAIPSARGCLNDDQA